LVVANKTNNKTYKRFRDALNEVDLVDFQVVERYLMKSVDTAQAQQIIDNAQKDTPLDVIIKYTEEYSKADVGVLKEELNSIFEDATNLMAQGE